MITYTLLCILFGLMAIVPFFQDALEEANASGEYLTPHFIQLITEMWLVDRVTL